jgi:hypothetical protein
MNNIMKKHLSIYRHEPFPSLDRGILMHKQKWIPSPHAADSAVFLKQITRRIRSGADKHGASLGSNVPASGQSTAQPGTLTDRVTTETFYEKT